jgi:acetyl-CoA C-acetyltransferase
MSEAVIVSTARSPIGRAFKGSLKDERPDDLAAAMVAAALARIPSFDAADATGQGLDDLYLGCAEPSGEAGSNMARVVTILAGLDNVFVPPASRRSGWPSTPSRPARGTRSSRPG